MILPVLAITAGIFVITTKNAIISVFNLIVLYILVAFYLIYIGITYLGISYIVVYIGAIAILFLFVIMMIDIEVVEKRSNNYLPLLFLLLVGFLFTLKNILFNIGVVKMKSFTINITKKIEPVKKEDLFISEKVQIIREEESELEVEEDINRIVNLVRNTIDRTKLEKYTWTSSSVDNDEVLYPINERNNYDWVDEDNINYSKIDNDDLPIKSLSSFDKVEEEMEEETDYIWWNWDIKFTNNLFNHYEEELHNNNYLLVVPNWDLAANRVTQISAIGDVLYTVYHSYIYIISVLLLLGMIGAIILTADNPKEIKLISKSTTTLNGFYNPWLILKWINSNLIFKLNLKFNGKQGIKNFKSNSLILPFFEISNSNHLHSEGIIGNLFYFMIATLIIAALLLFINSYFSLSVKYLDKGGGFECGFTSFVQTRERFNVIFYRVSLLFLVFDLEIILIFPYTAIYQKYQNISKNNVLAFLYILIVGFIYELKEGALNIVKKAHTTEINNPN